jgi:hypothetical protein
LEQASCDPAGDDGRDEEHGAEDGQRQPEVDDAAAVGERWHQKADPDLKPDTN